MNVIIDDERAFFVVNTVTGQQIELVEQEFISIGRVVSRSGWNPDNYDIILYGSVRDITSQTLKFLNVVNGATLYLIQPIICL
jgi:hypothetical protein